MQTSEIAFLSASELARHIRDKSLSPVEITAAVLQRAEASQPVLNAFITITAEQALAAAREAEAAIVRGEKSSDFPPEHDLAVHEAILQASGMST